jgi:translocation and assembly module TamA
MQRFIALLIFITVLLSAKEFEKLEFKGEGIDFLMGTFSSSNLYKVIGKPYPPFYTPWRDDPTFDDVEIPKYEELITDYFNAHGYYKVTLNSTVGKDAITIDINKNEPIKIKEIKVHPTEGLRRYLPFKEGDIFTTEGFKESKKIIERKLLEEGYPRYFFEAKAYVDLDLYEAKIDYHVDKNMSVKLSDTFISGRGDVKEEIIKEAITYKNGDTYDIRELEKTYDNIYEFGVYDYITVEPKIDENTSTVPVDIELKMGDTKFFKNSIGYNTDTGPRGSLSWIDKNFFGNLKVFDVGFKVSKLGYEAYNIFYNPRIILPYIGKIDFKNEINYHLIKYDSYDERGLVNRVTFGKKVFGLEHYFGLLTEISKIKSKVDGTDDESGSYFINSFFYRLLIDKRDSMVDAKRGYYASFYLEKSDKIIGSDLDYLKALVELRYIKSFMHDKLTLGLKTRLGSINSDVPTFKRFYTGGSFTNRGYDFQELGLKDRAGVPRGGVSLIDVLGEVRYEVFSKFSTVLFYDSSMLSIEPHTFDDEFYDSWGFGIRYLTPIGPFRLDFGFPRDEPGWTFHISIGQVF